MLYPVSAAGGCVIVIPQCFPIYDNDAGWTFLTGNSATAADDCWAGLQDMSTGTTALATV